MSETDMTDYAELREEKAATPHNELIAQLLDSRVPKSDREHASAREIERLRAEVEGLHEQLRLATVDHVNAEAEANDARAEAEALRREVEEWKCVASAQAELHDEAEECAERLAKALAGLITWIPSADTYRRLGFDPAAPMRALEQARAALGSGGLRDD